MVSVPLRCIRIVSLHCSSMFRGEMNMRERRAETAMAKSYEELTLADDFMFCKVMTQNPDLCRELTELITGRKVGEILKINRQMPVESQRAVRSWNSLSVAAFPSVTSGSSFIGRPSTSPMKC